MLPFYQPLHEKLADEKDKMVQEQQEKHEAKMLEEHGKPEDLRVKITELYRKTTAHLNEPDPHINWNFGPTGDPPMWSCWLFSEGREPNLVTYEGEGRSLQEALLDLLRVVDEGEEAYRLSNEAYQEKMLHQY